MYEVKKDWTTKAGLRAVVIFAHGSHHCGYVGILKEHPLYGVGYSEHSDALLKAMERVKEEPIGKRNILSLLCYREGEARPEIVFDVHGGITYSGGNNKYPVEGDEWWFGFDCAHAGDKCLGRMGLFTCPGDVFRDVSYVEAECERLAEQLVEVK